MARTKTKAEPDVEMIGLLGFEDDPQQYPEGSTPRAVAEDDNAIRDLLGSAREEERRLKKLGYNAESLRHRLWELTSGHRQRLSKAERDVSAFYRPKLEEMKKALEIEKGPQATLSSELRQQEIRTRLAAMDGAKAQLLFLDAVEPDGFDEELFLAVRSAPSVYGNFGMDQTLIEDATETWQKIKDPAATRDVEQLGTLIERLETSVRVVRAEIEKMTGNRGVDPLRQMAEKIGARSLAS